jgi:carbon-monoxide dehydrogenase large subunit
VRYVGEAVAVVVADTKAQARDAADAVVNVSYEELPAVVEAVDALKPGAPQIMTTRRAT